MASNRDPQKDYRINKRGRKVKVTSSSTRAARVKKASAPKPTSSSTRSRGKGTGSKRITSDSTRARGTGVKTTGSKPTPTKVKTKAKPIVMGGDTGRRGGGPNQPARSGPPIPKTPKTPGRFVDKPQVKANVKALQNSLPGRLLKGAGRKGGMIGAALTIAEGAKQYFGSQRSQAKTRQENQGAAYRAQQKPLPKVKQPAVKPKPNPKPKKKPQPQQKLGAGAKAFDSAFAKARAAGKKTFTFKGKSYHTRLKK